MILVIPSDSECSVILFWTQCKMQWRFIRRQWCESVFGLSCDLWNSVPLNELDVTSGAPKGWEKSDSIGISSLICPLLGCWECSPHLTVQWKHAREQYAVQLLQILKMYWWVKNNIYPQQTPSLESAVLNLHCIALSYFIFTSLWFDCSKAVLVAPELQSFSCYPSITVLHCQTLMP